jgi:tRNA (guanine-N7-)-methyltransferase
VRLKTDDRELFDYSIEQFTIYGWENVSLTHDLHNSPLLIDHHGIQTHYEKLALEE